METYYLFNQTINNIIKWARQWEKTIEIDGIGLNQEQLNLAARLGIKHPEKIKILNKSIIPLPPESIVVLAAKKQGLKLDEVAGITFGYGIILIKNRADDFKLLTHEMVHVLQYERLGFENFLYQYVKECTTMGYNSSSLEKEAIELTEKINE